MAKTKVNYKITYSMEIEGLDYNSVSCLREALSEKGAKLLNWTPIIFNEIIETCEHILEEEQ